MSDNKNTPNDFDSFLAYLRGENASDAPKSASNQTGIDDEDAFNVVNAMAPRSSAPAPAEEPAAEEPVRQYVPKRAARHTAPQAPVSPSSSNKAFIKSWKDIKDDKPAAAPVISGPSVAIPDEEGDEEEEMGFIARRKNRQKRTRFKLLKSMTWLMIMLVISVFLSIFIVESCGDVFGYNMDSEDVTFVVFDNDTPELIAKRLSDKGIIQQEITFKFYAKFKEITDGFSPGTYTLNPDMSYDEILAITRKVTTNEKEVVKITFREGLTAYEVAELLEENRVCSAESFLETLETEDFSYAFMRGIPKNDPLRFRRLEGYLFPDTYDFYVGENTVSVAKKFFNNFNNKITASMYEKMEEQDISLDELVTLASIIQKEAGRAKEMYRVSSVFRNRLNSNGGFPLLQSDTTTNYIEEWIKPFLDAENPELIAAYDTYSTYGLPSGPICNPGINALRAALDPAETPYYFFLSDAMGKYYYARNYNEHQNNAFIAAKVGDGTVTGIGVGKDD